MKQKQLDTLQTNLKVARGILWEAIREGNFDTPEMAEDTFQAFKATTKALDISQEKLSQLPLIKGGMSDGKS